MKMVSALIILYTGLKLSLVRHLKGILPFYAVMQACFLKAKPEIFIGGSIKHLQY